MTKRCLHLDSGAVFRKLALNFFILREAWFWLFRMRRIRAHPLTRLLWFLFSKHATPYSLLYALLFATVATTVLAVLVRLVIEPLLRRWLTPWTDGSAGQFHLAANERVVGASPGRRASGRRWPAGTLVVTDLRLWFFPIAHDAEIWSRPLDALRDVRLEPAPRFASRYLRGWPDRLALEASDGPRPGDGDGEHEVFAVADPDAVLGWFPAGAADQAPRGTSPDLSIPRRL